MSDPGYLLDIPAAAERLGVTQRWVRRAAAERRISFVKVGLDTTSGVELEAISRYIERQRKPARDDARVNPVGRYNSTRARSSSSECWSASVMRLRELQRSSGCAIRRLFLGV